MLLRSVTKHITDQNWFAVFVDFLIVVVGVFLGIQIGEWNEERQLRERTVVLSQRLADDFGVDVWLASGFSAYNQVVIDNAKLVLGDLTNRKPLADNELMVAAFRATQYNRLLKSSTYKELVSTGGYDLLAKSELGKIATVYYESTFMEDIQADGKTSDYRQLYRTHMPIEVQLQAAEVCGDRIVPINQLITGESSLSYACELTLAENQLTKAAAVLRSRPEFADALRRRIANLSQQNSDFDNLLEALKPYRASTEVLQRSGTSIIYREQ